MPQIVGARHRIAERPPIAVHFGPIKIVPLYFIEPQWRFVRTLWLGSIIFIIRSSVWTQRERERESHSVFTPSARSPHVPAVAHSFDLIHFYSISLTLSRSPLTLPFVLCPALICSLRLFTSLSLSSLCQALSRLSIPALFPGSLPDSLLDPLPVSYTWRLRSLAFSLTRPTHGQTFTGRKQLHAQTSAYLLPHSARRSPRSDGRTLSVSCSPFLVLAVSDRVSGFVRPCVPFYVRPLLHWATDLLICYLVRSSSKFGYTF